MFELLALLARRWKLIFGVSLAAGVLAAGLSLLLPDYFASTVVFQPVNPNTLDRSIIFPGDSETKPLYVFGGPADIDRVLTLGTSTMMYNHLIETFGLYQHYDIDPGERLAAYKVVEELKSNYTIIKNARGAVEITVLDQDPQLAADMANEAYRFLDVANRELIMRNSERIYSVLEKERVDLFKRTEQLRDSLRAVLTAGATDTIQAKYWNSLLAKATEDYGDVNSQYDQYAAILKLDKSTMFLYEAAVPAIRKDQPRRSLIAIGAALLAFGAMVVTTLFVDQYKTYRRERSSAASTHAR